MKLLVVMASGLALAACQPAQEPELAGPPPVESTPVPAPVPETPPPLGTAAAIPANFHGKWDESAEACGRSSIMTLTVSANELRFHESIGEINKVTPEGENTVTVSGPFDGEGQQWEGTMKLEVSPDGNTLTATNNGTATPRVKCS